MIYMLSCRMLVGRSVVVTKSVSCTSLFCIPSRVAKEGVYEKDRVSSQSSVSQSSGVWKK
jgi:hypothetical protein